MKYVIASGQSIGTRSRQEDSFDVVEELFPDSLRLLIVADGMGGESRGDLASATAVVAFRNSMRMGSDRPFGERLRAALSEANNAIATTVRQHPSMRGMGTTLLAVLLTEDGQLQWISVGDSPLWLLRDGALQRLNEDHSMAGAFSELVAVGRMTAKSAQIASNRSALRSVVAGGPIDLIDLPAPVKLKAGDTVVLASDGLLTVEPEVLTERLTEAANLQMEIVVSALLNAVEERREPEQDNTTLIVAQVCSR